MSYVTSDAVHPGRPPSSHVPGDSRGNRFLKTSIVGVIGCPFSGGQPRAGVDTGPHHLIDFGLLDQIEELGYNVTFGGHHQFAQVMESSKENDPDIGKLKRPKYVGSVTHALKQAVEETCKRGELVLTLGGDHSLAIGTVSGVFAAYPDACLIWIDAVTSSLPVAINGSMRISILLRLLYRAIFTECRSPSCLELRASFRSLLLG